MAKKPTTVMDYSKNNSPYQYDFFISVKDKDDPNIHILVSMLIEKGFCVYDNSGDDLPFKYLQTIIDQSRVVLSFLSTEHNDPTPNDLAYAKSIGKTIHFIDLSNIKKDKVGRDADIKLLLDDILEKTNSNNPSTGFITFPEGLDDDFDDDDYLNKPKAKNPDTYVPFGSRNTSVFEGFANQGQDYEERLPVYSSIFAPAEIKKKAHMLIQVYLHLLDETETVIALAQESNTNATRRDYIPLQCRLQNGDKVDVLLNIYGETMLMSDRKSVVWQGHFTKCSFDFFVSKDIDVDELFCKALLTVNDTPVGEMRFVTRIVEVPDRLNSQITSHRFNKVFISYSHKDEPKVKFLHEGLELGGIAHFFDRQYLKTGDVFPQVIQDYIDSADLFILCWSKNAANSEYVKKERLQALGRAFPQIRPAEAAKLSIYPISINPRTELPDDMKDNYHFGEI